MLYGLVNNAGAGIEHGVTDDVVIKTNFYGPKRVCDNLLQIIDQNCGRIVNVGSGAGPAFVDKILDIAVKKQVMNFSFTVFKIIFYFSIADVLSIYYMAGIGDPHEALS